MNKLLLGVIAMAIIVAASNILVQYPIGQWLTWGAFTYPFAFLVSELVNRFEGAKAARRVVYAGFAVGLICSVIGTQIIGEFGPLVTLRVAIGSGAAFLIGQLLDVSVFDKLRRTAWWRAPFLGSLLGSSVDTVLFFTLAFSSAFIWLDPASDVSWAAAQVPLLGFGPEVPLWVSLGLADFCVKVAVDLIALMPFRLAIAKYASRLA
ncbi:queuosine precursor transporter [Cypionkella sp.]|uniref:queuosine precursor transporter n=1 Tax=Cypionkella sp. TaxID=2811411 RepID=UPI0027291CF3|nr:queuosine precursor transporter [Cypionkella sp.]MDO8984589.1 queuosine precursor transporter [Cypionkella sp.]MDP1576051.1 queuosine precursor transporter [Cypionkella sp.]MDP2049342.1 queuosine precursor transporter [Cypionkella sp.]